MCRFDQQLQHVPPADLQQQSGAARAAERPEPSGIRLMRIDATTGGNDRVQRTLSGPRRPGTRSQENHSHTSKQSSFHEGTRQHSSQDFPTAPERRNSEAPNANANPERSGHRETNRLRQTRGRLHRRSSPTNPSHGRSRHGPAGRDQNRVRRSARRGR
uniref:(northern house mosquito) hypothetical protein n=1 Tax=Culex pipiens TaxID=7175 RepID=A0A8D8N3J5_CULPI